MKVIEKILYFTFDIGWILAPLIVGDILKAGNIILPYDLGVGGIAIWYVIGWIQVFGRTERNLIIQTDQISYHTRIKVRMIG